MLIGAGLVAISFAISPDLWVRWIETMQLNTGYLGPGYFTIPIPLAPRLVAAVVVMVFAARTDRAWLLPVAGWLALSVLWWPTMAALIAALHRPAVAASRDIGEH